ncbi:hypothetical protein QCA50_020233 [Cerrena zonata]|uniref:C3H1-type domain-containing protein n=1 Tax=Cerrena zonata TaxID=2478898 RepID=A0AAW0FI15_9APHY
MSNFDTVWLTLHHTLTSQKNQHRLCLWGRNYYGLACPLSRCASQHFATQVRATLRPPKNANKGVHYLVYVNWDYEEYCAECRGVKVARGDNSAKEGKLREKWGPKTRGTMRIDTPRTVVDRKGIIMTWILPEVIPQKYQEEVYLATKSLEGTLASNLRSARDSTSWRSSPGLFNPDSDYIRSGFANLSPAWYMSGRSVRFSFSALNAKSELILAQIGRTSYDSCLKAINRKTIPSHST